MLIVRSPTLSPTCSLKHLYWVVYTQICIRTSLKVALFADRDYGAMAVTCRGGGDTLSLTKEINFPVP